MMASAMAVELTVALLHHPLGKAAPADDARDLSVPTESKFGLLPHQIRGYLTHFLPLIVTGRPFDRCTACSPTIIQAYRERDLALVIDAMNSSEYLDRVTGLDALQAAAVDACVDWDDEEDGDDDDASDASASHGNSDGEVAVDVDAVGVEEA